MKYALVIDNKDGSSAISSVPQDLGDLTCFSFQCSFTGSTLDGTFYISASNINEPDYFVPIPESEISVTDAEKIMLVVTNGTFRYVRAEWEPTSGTGNITCVFMLKEPPR